MSGGPYAEFAGEGEDNHAPIIWIDNVLEGRTKELLAK